MSKFYRARKDSFMWEEGAILEYDDDSGTNGGYRAISDLWDNVELENEYISKNIVEKNPGWFERVYEISVLGKAKYLVKDAAKKAHDTLHKV